MTIFVTSHGYVRHPSTEQESFDCIVTIDVNLNCQPVLVHKAEYFCYIDTLDQSDESVY